MNASTITARRNFTLPHRAMSYFGVVAAVTMSASSGAPTPLYRLYQEQMAISPLLLTVIFAVYVLGLLGALLTVGRMSDFVGRKPMIGAALFLNVVAMVEFITAENPLQLILARFVQGVATGTATATLGAAILDGDPKRGPVLNSVTAFVGLTVGTLGAGLLAAYAPAPTRLVYALLLVISVLEAATLLILPETNPGRAGALASIRPRLAIPAAARAMFVLVSPGSIASWGLGGFYLSLMPSLARATIGITSPLLGGLIVSTLMMTAALVVFASRRYQPAIVRLFGAGALALGIVVTLIGISMESLGTLLIGTVIGGSGFGANFAGVLRSLLPLASQGERAGLLSTFYVQSYLAFALPAIGAGLLAPRLGLELTADLYGAVLFVLVMISLTGTLAQRLRTTIA